MAVWYATGNGNINSVGRWNSAANGSGSTLTWPAAADDVLMANGRTVTVNVNTAVAEVRTDTAHGATVGGTFTLSNGIALTANAYMGSSGSSVISFSAASGTLTGNFYGGPGSGSYGILVTGTGTLTITGNVYSGPAGSTNCHGAYNNAGSTINITGNAISLGGGFGVNNNGAGTITVSGYVEASTAIAGANNAAQGILQVGETRTASNGRGAVTGAFRFASATAAKHLPIIAGSQKTLSVLDVAALVPAVEDVRATVKYGDGAYTGTLALNRKRLSMAGRF